MCNRLLHTMIRVLDLDASIAFYTTHLGMRVLRRNDYESGRFSLVFVGYGDESEDAVLELTHNWDQTEPYETGTGFGHFAIGVPDVYAACDAMRAAGVKITREPGPMQGSATVLAFVEDPDGYKIELLNA
ncbi:MAG: lactoylglutathione lyase [Rhodospirillaceae bacterium]|nr:lactoylglutathione lyase [Rhodospirillaceae bacterium]